MLNYSLILLGRAETNTLENVIPKKKGPSLTKIQLFICNCRICMEHWTWNTEYMERGTLESWNIGTLVMEHWTWNTGHGTLVMEHWTNGTLDMERWTWNTGQIEHRPREHWIWNTGTLSMEHWIHGRLETTTVAHWAWNTETLNIEH